MKFKPKHEAAHASPLTSGKPAWPTLAGRLNQPLTSRVEAVRQLQTTMPLTRVAQDVLKRSSKRAGRLPTTRAIKTPRPASPAAHQRALI